MKGRSAALLEPQKARSQKLRASLEAAGLQVTKCLSEEELTTESWVVVGPSITNPKTVAKRVRAKNPHAFIFAALTKGEVAPWADGVLPLPVSVRDLKVRLKELTAQRAESLRPQAPTTQNSETFLDPITLFYTFAHFKEFLFVEVKRAQRYGFPLALGLIGLDPLEKHVSPAIQSQMMSLLAIAIRRAMRDTDYPVRFTEGRVLVLMPHTDLAGSLIVARRICDRIATATIQYGDVELHPKVSIGVAAGIPGTGYGFADLIRQAQDGLSEATNNGGNRVEFVGEIHPKKREGNGTSSQPKSEGPPPWDELSPRITETA